MALKEWSTVCLALAQGRQAFIARKGGIHDRRGGFRVEHRDFWLFPTFFHEGQSDLVAAAADLLEPSRAVQPPAGMLHISCFAEVARVVELRDERLLPKLSGLHILHDQTLRARFHYKQPGLHLLIVRAYRLATPHLLRDEPGFAGCRSWVRLPRELATCGATPAMSDEAFGRCERAILEAVNQADLLDGA